LHLPYDAGSAGGHRGRRGDAVDATAQQSDPAGGRDGASARHAGHLASYLLVSHEQANFAGAVKDRNRAFMSAVDAELKGHVTSLQALTSLRSIVRDDLKAAYEDLVAVQRTQPWWLDVFLSTPDGRQLVNSLVPYGSPLPAPIDPPSVRRAASA